MSFRRVSIRSHSRTLIDEIYRLRQATKEHSEEHRCYLCDKLKRLCDEMRKREMSHASRALVNEFIRPAAG